MSSAVEIIDGAQELVLRGWTQGAEARGEDDRPVSSLSECAVKWCMLGALNRAGWDLWTVHGLTYQDVCDGLSRVFEAVMDAMGLSIRRHSRDGSIVSWNDNVAAQPEDVLAVLRAARERLVREEKSA